jgi:hypothetical protein
VVAAGPSDWRAVLRQRGVSPETIAMIAEAEIAARSAALPPLDADVSRAHADLYQQLGRARAEVERALSYAAMSPSELAWARFARLATVAVVVLLALGALYFALRTPEETRADASATFGGSPSFAPENIVDGNPATEWLLPDRATGWVEARVSPARHVSRVTLTNSTNPPHFDRATREYRVELYSASGEVLGTADGTFERYERSPQPVAHEFDVDEVARVRLVVRSSHNLGAGLAEMEIE